MSRMMTGTTAGQIRLGEDEHRENATINVGHGERLASGLFGGVLVAAGLRKGTFGGLALAVTGGALLYRGYSGYCSTYHALGIDTNVGPGTKTDPDQFKGRLVKHAVTVNKPAAPLYDYWRDVEKLTTFMNHVESIRKLSDTRSHWTLKGPLGTPIAFDSEIVVANPHEVIAWKSMPGAPVPNAGAVRFTPAQGGRGTVVTLEMSYESPGGALGAGLAKALGQDPDTHVTDHLRRFKQLMEAGEIATVSGQPAGAGRS